MKHAGLFLLAACGHVDFASVFFDAAPRPPPDACTYAGAFGAPMVVSELSDPTVSQRDPALSADKLYIVFKREAPNTGALWQASRASVDASWDPPTLIAELDTPLAEFAPSLTP